MYLALMGYALIVVMMWGLLKGKVIPAVAFCTLPVIFAILAGFSPVDVTNFASEGVTKALSAAVMGFFATAYFSIMTKEGLFDPIVEALAKKAGGNITAIMIMSAIVASIAHMDTGTTSTIFVTIPAMMPIFKRYHMRLEYLFVIIAQAVSVVNIMPHGGGMVRVSSLTGLDISYMFQAITPVLIVGFIINIVMALFYAKIEQRRINTLGLTVAVGAGGGTMSVGGEPTTENSDTEIKKLDVTYYLNLILTLGILYLMFANIFKSYVVFMIGFALALMINYKTTKKQNSILNEVAPSAFSIGLTTLTSGVLVGIMTGTGMLTAMANVIVLIIPQAFNNFFALIISVLGIPLSISLGGDAFYFGLLPLFVEVAQTYSIPTMAIAAVMMLAKDGFSMITPVSAVTHLAPGLMNIELKDLMKFSFKYLCISYFLKIALCVVFGIIPLVS